MDSLVICPKCNKIARQTQDSKSCEFHINCDYCGYDSADIWEIEPNIEDEDKYLEVILENEIEMFLD